MKAEKVKPLFLEAVKKLGITEECNFLFETPKNPEHGDLTTSIAMRLAKQLKKNPRQIAQEIIDQVSANASDMISKIEIAGPGFINITLSGKFYADGIRELFEKGENVGRSDFGKMQRVNVEYVSVNPTGLLHLGHGRNSCLGDTVATLYHWSGYDVTREYYFNNAGNQMQNLAKSIYARYMQLFQSDFPFPEDGYHGEYIKLIADEIREKFDNTLKDPSVENMQIIRKYGEKWCFEKIKATLERMKIKQDVFYNEDSLYNTGKIQEILDFFKEKKLSYVKDGATWLKFSELGLQDDRVIVKSTGEPTYRLPDIAYHREKFRRGFDILIDIFGADHVATIPDVMAGVKALGYDSSKVHPVIYQFVTLTENGEQVKMSKRTGKSYTLDDLLDEVGPDVVRFFLLMRSGSTHLEFDLNLAREQSEKNPVFYLQYANARISSVIDNAKEAGIKLENDIDFSLLTHPREISLINTAMNFGQIILDATRKCEPQILADYLRLFASEFHAFYHDCRIIGVETDLQKARLALAITTKNIIKNGLTILGISTPDRM